MSETSGKIGVALAAYKPNPMTFAEQLASIQAQTFREWVCFIGLDSPLSEIKEDFRFAKFFGDSRFYWFENPKRLGHLRNFEQSIHSVLSLGATAIACCDQDDIWFPEKLEISMRELSRLSGMGLVFSDMKIMSAEGQISDQTAWIVERRGVDHTGTFDLLVRNVVPGTGMLMDAELVRKFPKIPEDAVYHDHWYPLVASRVGKIAPICRPLYAYRIHDENVAGLNPFEGIFAQKTSENESIIGKCKTVWARSKKLALAAEQAGLNLTFIEKAAFIRNGDLGTILWWRGLFCLFSDPALARACFARAVGKFLSIF